VDGAPHYFASQFDEGTGDYSDNFKVYPVGPEFMQRAMRSWEIYRAWESRFHNNEAELSTHPGHGNIDAEYDELESWLDAQIARLQALPTLYKAKFRALPNQDGLPLGILRALEVAWSPSSA
jgi:hypothetical protein